MPSSTPAPIMPAPRFAFPALILANIILALGPVLVRLTDVGPMAAAFWRLALALPILAVLAMPGVRRAGLRPAQWTMMAIAGLLFAADLASWHLGIAHTKVANSTLFGNASALALPLWGMIVLRQRPAPLQVAALLLASVGAAILMGGSYELSPRNLHGDLLCLLAGLLYTAYLLVIQDARKTLDSWSVLALASAAGAPPLLAAALLMGERTMPGDWTWVVVLALSSQVIGQGLLTYAINWFSPLVLGLSLLVQPAVSALLGWLLFDEWLSVADLWGAVAVSIALVLVRLPTRA
ncbi:DMT family transporter [Sphingobium olei]|uniref:DMT family transporter n=1 Tax=Sphingobium olei TaxID=420955 RepID=A0ABW3P0U7_9SPHN|nr:DMT family transporter [Sphingobium sp.]